MSEKLRGEEYIGFLPHEIKFIIGALEKAVDNLRNANMEYGEAVSNSGGDWAFDDSASQVAAHEAQLKERDHSHLALLSNMIRNSGQIEYPEADSEVSTFGSRVQTVEDDGFVETYDLSTHYIPGLPREEGVHLISPSAPIAQYLHGTKEGDVIKWQAPNGYDLEAKITGVDQQAIRKYYGEE